MSRYNFFHWKFNQSVLQTLYFGRGTLPQWFSIKYFQCCHLFRHLVAHSHTNPKCKQQTQLSISLIWENLRRSALTMLSVVLGYSLRIIRSRLWASESPPVSLAGAWSTRIQNGLHRPCSRFVFAEDYRQIATSGTGSLACGVQEMELACARCHRKTRIPYSFGRWTRCGC